VTWDQERLPDGSIRLSHSSTPSPPPVWWMIEGDDLLAMLRRVRDGEDPDIVYAEEYANCEHERPS
jgi:hypothetical protein